jgi:hypothetical protein
MHGKKSSRPTGSAEKVARPFHFLPAELPKSMSGNNFRASGGVENRW